MRITSSWQRGITTWHAVLVCARRAKFAPVPSPVACVAHGLQHCGLKFDRLSYIRLNVGLTERKFTCRGPWHVLAKARSVGPESGMVPWSHRTSGVIPESGLGLKTRLKPRFEAPSKGSIVQFKNPRLAPATSVANHRDGAMASQGGAMPRFEAMKVDRGSQMQWIPTPAGVHHTSDGHLVIMRHVKA